MRGRFCRDPEARLGLSATGEGDAWVAPGGSSGPEPESSEAEGAPPGGEGAGKMSIDSGHTLYL